MDKLWKLLLNVLSALAVILLRKKIAGDDDTSELEGELADAETPEAVNEILKREAIKVIDEKWRPDEEIPPEVIGYLAGARTTGELVEALDRPQMRKTLLAALVDLTDAVTTGIAKTIGDVLAGAWDLTFGWLDEKD